MPSAEERERSERLATPSGAALPAGYLDDVSRVAAIYEALGGLREITSGLKGTTESHTQKIEQLAQQVYAIPYIKEDVAKNTNDLNELGKRHTRELNELGVRLERNVNELERQQTANLNQLGIRLGNEISDLRSDDIGDLKSTAKTAENIFRIFLGVLAIIVTVIAPPVLIYLFRHFSITFKP